MPACPKHRNYRNPKILDSARVAPHCMRCGVAQDGQVVACHSNAIRHGHGQSIKAHDIPAYLCPECHDLVDGRNQGLSTLLPREARERIFLEAVYETILWLLESGTMRRIA